MPIGNAYLSQWHVVRAWAPTSLIEYAENNGFLTYPEAIQTAADTSVSTPPGMTAIELAFNRFSSKVEAEVRPAELVQGYPLAKTHEISAASWVYEIETPVILAPSNQAGEKYKIRINEIAFWMSWITYMFSSFDRLSYVDDGVACNSSAVVENASATINSSGLSLALKIRSNFDLGWTTKMQTDEIASGARTNIVGRPAMNYDCFVKFEDYASPTPLLFQGIGIENAWGVTSFQSQASTTSQIIVTTPFSSSASGISTAIREHLIVDQINAKLVNMTGKLDAFGSTDLRDVTYGNISNNSSGNFSTATSVASGSEAKYYDVINSNMTGGSFQLYVGAYHGSSANGIAAIPLLMMPAGMIVSGAGISAGQGLISISRDFSGVICNTPSVSGVGPKALLNADGS